MRRYYRSNGKARRIAKRREDEVTSGIDGPDRAASAIPFTFAEYTPDQRPHDDNGHDVEADCVDLWAYSLGVNAPLASWLALITAHERDRAMRFVRDGDRARFAIAHAVMRTILAQYVGGDPSEVDIRSEPAGKPLLGERHRHTGITFSLAHCEDRALVGVSKGRRVGVDLERERESTDVPAIAKRFFSTREHELIAARPANERSACFFRHWVAKEAVLKAHGAGMAISPQGFDVAFHDAQTARVHSVDPDTPGSQWVVRMLGGDGGWHGAVAAAGDAWRLRLRMPTARPG